MEKVKENVLSYKNIVEYVFLACKHFPWDAY